MGQLQTFEEKIKAVTTVKDLFEVKDVKDRYIANYQAVSNRQDGENRWQQERFAYLQAIADKPDLQKAGMFWHMSAIVYAGTTGLSFRDNKLYVQSNGKGGIKVQPSPSGKREMFLMMKAVKDVPEGVIVYKGDHFIHDKKNQIVKEHYSTDKTKEDNNIENIRAAYQTIHYKDGTSKDVVVYQDEIKKAMQKSPMQGDKSTWAIWTSEMAKKTALNRAFKLYHHYPDNVVLFNKVDEDDDTEETSYQDMDMPDAPENVDQDTGEITPTEEVTSKDPKKQSSAGEQQSFM